MAFVDVDVPAQVPQVEMVGLDEVELPQAEFLQPITMPS